MLCGFTDIMKPQDGNTAVSAPLNGYCYLCTTQEEHRQHLVRSVVCSTGLMVLTRIKIWILHVKLMI